MIGRVGFHLVLLLAAGSAAHAQEALAVDSSNLSPNLDLRELQVARSGKFVTSIPNKLNLDEATGPPQIRVPPTAIGIYNDVPTPLEFVVTTKSSGQKTYKVGPNEIVTIECGECLNDLEVSIATPGQEPFKRSFAGGTVVVPTKSGDSDSWALAPLNGK